MKRSFRMLAIFLAFGCGIAVAQVSQQEQKAEDATEAKSGIHDNIEITSGPTVDQVSANSAALHWKTNGVAATRVNYGTDPHSLHQTGYVAGGATQHDVVLHNLKPRTTYYYEIENKSGKDRYNGSFTTH